MDDEIRNWTAALASGARAAGHALFASRIESGEVATDFVHYADLFVEDQAQGQGLDLTEDEAEFLVRLITGFVDEQLEECTEPAEQELLQHARATLTPTGQEQGILAPVRWAINATTSLLALPGLQRAGQWAGSKLLVRDFAQVARYLGRSDELDTRIRRRLHDALDREPDVVIAHSLGSVVAWEALHEHPGRLPLLVTLGSPLAMRTVVWPHLVPRPPATPPGVQQWLNCWDRDDIIVARPRLENEIRANADNVRLRSVRIDSDGFWTHTATKYLCQAQLAGPVAEVAARETPG
ncbi:hypothetical protein [Actinoplanes sp. NPDC026619]|uniref:hypothetical protein n=1 Tax=Actinoplanes sp. NPDC026619 TaxID=3155798 RepID=UPI0033FF1C10